MNTTELKGDWKTFKGELRKKYGQLTDNDLEYAKGQEESLIGRIQSKSGEAAEKIKEFFKGQTSCSTSPKGTSSSSSSSCGCN